MDLLSEILQSVKLRGTVYFHARFQPPWGMNIPKGEFANYHIVTNGTCWLHLDSNQDSVLLQKGDMVLFPHGHSHALSDSLTSDIIPAKELLTHNRENELELNEVVFGGDGADATRLICGHYEFDRTFSHPLFKTLPKLIHLSTLHSKKFDWFATASELAAKISSSNEGPGQNAVIDKLAESLFVQALVSHIETMDNPSSFLAAIQNKNIGLVLQAIHDNSTHNWNLAELANIASMSKSVFSEKFHKLVGEAPIVYLARWRMLKAHELLVNTALPIHQISEMIGYKSEFSFSKAFKKFTGVSPGEIRRSARG